jgi:hypothetical protein
MPNNWNSRRNARGPDQSRSKSGDTAASRGRCLTNSVHLLRLTLPLRSFLALPHSIFLVFLTFDRNTLTPKNAAMSVFNPMILDASIQAITSSLRDEQKAEVLLFAACHLNLQRSGSTLVTFWNPRRGAAQAHPLSSSQRLIHHHRLLL